MGNLEKLITFTGFANVHTGNLVMILIGIILIYLAIKKDFEPLLLIPIGFGILIGNIPFYSSNGINLEIGINQNGSILNYLYFGVIKGIYPPLIFLGIGAMTDFSAMLSNPKLILLGAAAQLGIFLTFWLALTFGFTPEQAASIGIIGGANGPIAIFLTNKLAPELLGVIAISAYLYMALVPVIQPPIIKLLTTKKERLIKMKPPRPVSKKERIIFPVVGLIISLFLTPAALPLLGMLFFGNILRESGVTKRLAETAARPLIDIVTIILGLAVGASTQADVFLRWHSVLIFFMGAFAFITATVGGVGFAKLMNLFLKEAHKVNPIIGAAGVSAVPAAARVAQKMGQKYDMTNHLIQHAMGPNVAGVIGSAVAAGCLLSLLFFK